MVSRVEEVEVEGGGKVQLKYGLPLDIGGMGSEELVELRTDLKKLREAVLQRV